MRIYGSGSIHDFLGDFVVYRGLVPADSRLPSLDEMRPYLGLGSTGTPRKNELDYARVIVHLLERAQSLHAPGLPLEKLIYVGDTRLNDGTAFANICRVGGWQGVAFIGKDCAGPAKVEIVEDGDVAVYISNRWAALDAFECYCESRGVPIDDRTAVIVDLDKTALGARGRNDHVIDQARLEAVQQTVNHLLGDDFDDGAFLRAYSLLNKQEYHAFTSDNQDYLAYICLILGARLYPLDGLVDRVRHGWLQSFEQFVADVDGHAARLPSSLQSIHRRVSEAVQQGDPTAFKAFRHNEYHATVGRMGHLKNGASAERLLSEMIVITQEVRAAALAWRDRGALPFGLSDKPDEASIPMGGVEGQGYLPIHRVQTRVIGR